MAFVLSLAVRMCPNRGFRTRNDHNLDQISRPARATVSKRGATMSAGAAQPVALHPTSHAAEDALLGVDTHEHVHVAAMIAMIGGLPDTRSFPATTNGYEETPTDRRKPSHWRRWGASDSRRMSQPSLIPSIGRRKLGYGRNHRCQRWFGPLMAGTVRSIQETLQFSAAGQNQCTTSWSRQSAWPSGPANAATGNGYPPKQTITRQCTGPKHGPPSLVISRTAGRFSRQPGRGNFVG